MKDGIFNNPCNIIKRFYRFYFIQFLFLIKILFLFSHLKITEGRFKNLI